jgi:hypothetical protein
MNGPPRSWSTPTRVSFYCFLVASPLNLYGIGTGAFTYRFSRLLLVLTLGCLAIDSGINKRFVLRRLQLFDVLVLIYAALAVTSGLYVTNYSAFFARLFGLFECILILYVVRMQTTTLAELWKAVRVYVLSALFVVFAAGYQLYGLWHSFDAGLPFSSFLLYDKYEDVLGEVGHFGGVTADFMRISSTFGEPNMMGGYCASILPFIFVLALVQLSRKKSLSAAAYSLIGLGVVLTLISAVSKAAVLCVITSISVLVYLAFHTLTRKQKRVTILFCSSTLVAIVAYGLAAKDLFTQRLELGDSGHIAHRVEALHAFLTHPVLGFGYGNYEVISAHTLPLTALVELGISGGIIVSLISVVPLLSVRRFKDIASLGAERSRTLLFAACYASYCSVLIGLYLYDYWIHPFTWISISLLTSMVSQLRLAQAARFAGLPSTGSRTRIYQANTSI